MTKKTISFLFVLFSLWCNINTSTLFATEISRTQLEQIQKKTEVKKLAGKIDSLSEKIEIYKNFSDKIIDIFLAFLGITITAIIAFLGINWFGNNKKIEEKLRQIKQELLTEYEKKGKEIEVKNQKQIEYIKGIVNNDIVATKQELKLELLEYEYKKEDSEKQRIPLAIEILTLLSKRFGNAQNWESSFTIYLNVIMKFLNEGNKIDKWDASKIQAMLEVLPERYSEAKSRLSGTEIYSD